MDGLLAQVLLASASLLAGYAIRSRRLDLASGGTLLAAVHIAQANTPGDLRWGWVALCLNLGAAMFVLGYQRGAGAESDAWVSNLVVVGMGCVALASGHPFWVAFVLLLIGIATIGEAIRWTRARRAGDSDWIPLEPDATRGMPH